MPGKANAVCREPGCTELVANKERRCSKHLKTQWTRYTPTPQRTSGRTLQKQRDKLFRRSPFCAECERQGRVRAAAIRDHIIPCAEGGSDDDSNIQALCKECHDIKSAEEAKRGRERGGTPQAQQTTRRERSYNIA